MMDGTQFILATDGRQYYIESFLKSIVFGYYTLVDSKKQYSRKTVHEIVKEISKSDKAYNEIEDYLCTELINKYVKPNLHLFGLEGLVVDVGVRETKDSVTVGHLDVKFQVPSLAANHYYAFEAKRLDKNKSKQKYYISGGIKRFTGHKYYPETDTIVAGMIGFVEIESLKIKSRENLDLIKDSLNNHISSTTITTTQLLTKFKLDDESYSRVDRFKYIYKSKHTRDTDHQELSIYHIFLDYYDILLN
ncbi:hypothetical protein [Flavobacterium sp. FPG59]|uniref:hypothetical protein n=1 Tax=Flavobacterium sp. FPG59 TaxID=1929267 RepID=UPI000A3A44A9|nr:hypothetical protein [Flavobacterium sp. FPG59]OUD34779.1 hypothetical protein FPG59_12420 [Flavobacterium sp. FPG59]